MIRELLVLQMPESLRVEALFPGYQHRLAFGNSRSSERGCDPSKLHLSLHGATANAMGR